MYVEKTGRKTARETDRPTSPTDRLLTALTYSMVLAERGEGRDLRDAPQQPHSDSMYEKGGCGGFAIWGGWVML